MAKRIPWWQAAEIRGILRSYTATLKRARANRQLLAWQVFEPFSGMDLE